MQGGSTMKSGAVPKVHSARPMPFAMRKAVDTELRRLVDQGVIEAVDATTTPIEWPRRQMEKFITVWTLKPTCLH